MRVLGCRGDTDLAGSVALAGAGTSELVGPASHRGWVRPLRAVGHPVDPPPRTVRAYGDMPAWPARRR